MAETLRRFSAKEAAAVDSRVPAAGDDCGAACDTLSAWGILRPRCLCSRSLRTCPSYLDFPASPEKLRGYCSLKWIYIPRLASGDQRFILVVYFLER